MSTRPQKRRALIIGTRKDLHGDQLTHEQVKVIFSSVHQVQAAHQHDPTIKPIFRIIDTDLVATEDGHLEIYADIEVLDEQAFDALGPHAGLSLSFTMDGISNAPDDVQSAFELEVDRLHFDYKEVFKSLNALDNGKLFTVWKAYKKAAWIETSILTISVLSVSAFFAGFGNEAGRDIYKAIKGLRRKDEPEAPKRIQLHIRENEQSPKQIIELEGEEFLNNAVEEEWLSALDKAKLHSDKSISRIAAKTDEQGRLKVTLIVYVDGTYVSLGEL